MNQLLGFAVLTGPLWLILILVPVSIWLALKAAKRFQRRGFKIGIGLLVFLLFFLMPFADDVAGRSYLSYLCANKTEAKMYRTVELPKEYWDEQGKPRYIATNGLVDLKLLPNKFEWVLLEEPHIDSIIKIERWRSQLVDKETRAILGEKITYMRHFGWMHRLSPAPNIGETCRDLGAEHSRDEFLRREREQDAMFFRGIFKPAAIAR